MGTFKARLSDLQAGTRAIHRVVLPLVNTRAVGLPDLPELAEQRAADAASNGGDSAPATVEVGLRILTGGETAGILERARAFARGKGVDDPKEGDPLYELGRMVHTILLAAVDPESPPGAATPFFASTSEILDSPHIGRDGIVYLAECQESWQDVCSPQVGKVSPDELLEYVGRLAADSTSTFFVSLRPGTRWSLARTTALLLLDSLTLRSASGSTSAPSIDVGSETRVSETAAATSPTGEPG